jgi:hypothetical protein
VSIPLAWERLLWSGRSSLRLGARARYFLTDFRLVRQAGTTLDEIALHDITEVVHRQSRLDRLIGTSTLVVCSRDRRATPLVLHHVRRGAALAALLDLLSGESAPRLDAAAVRAALTWGPPRAVRPTVPSVGPALAVGLVVLAVFGLVVALHGHDTPPPSYAEDDAISPGGVKRDRADIVRFMKETIMPWARVTLGPITGGVDRVTCESCHGRAPTTVAWRMPAVAALPQPDVKDRGWEIYGGPMDAQMRNAIYGYLAEPDKQTKAAYMREVVLPGMARLLHRPAYDFTRPYAYNRSRGAFGCYHCHNVT